MLRIPPALRHRSFALLWGGLLISMVGTQMQQWALFWHVSTLSNDPIAVSIIGGVRFTAVLCFSLVGGLVADRYNRRNILFLTQSTVMVIAFILGFLTLAGKIQLWHIYALTAFQAIAMAFDLPARQALVPNLVPRDILPSAFSLQSIAFNTGSIIGPALSGIVIGYLGQDWVYFINALTYLAVIFALVALGNITQERKEIKSGFKAALADIRDGLHFIRHQPLILSSTCLDFIATFFSSANTLLPYLAQNYLHVNEIGYGWLAAAQSIGAVTVGLIASQHTQIRKQGSLLLGAVAVFGVATILFGVSRIYAVVFIALLLMGAADSVSTIIRNTVRQLITPDFIRGRMTSINQIFFMGGPQLGEMEAGAVAKYFGVPFAIITGGVGTILGVWLVASLWPALRTYNGDEAIPAN